MSFVLGSGIDLVPVRGVGFDIYPQEIVGLVGESGSGKSLTARACLGLIRPPGSFTARTLAFGDLDLMTASGAMMRSLRGDRMALVPQDPLSSFHPSLRIGKQMDDALKDHGVPRPDRPARIVESLRRVGLADPERQANRYPHQLSGGMRQRAMIALSLLNEPDLVIADEPTTALDATVQSQILQLLTSLSRERHLSVLLLTHNLGIVAGICSRVLVMYAGRIVEAGATRELFSNPQHPYTRALLNAVPRVDGGRPLGGIPGLPPSPWDRPSGCAFHPRCPLRMDRCSREEPQLLPTPAQGLAACWATQEHGTLTPPLPTLEPSPALATRVATVTRTAMEPSEQPTLFAVQTLTRHFKGSAFGQQQTVHALDDITLDISEGESVGIVGESGSGKSTLVRLLANLDRPSSGSITFDGWNLRDRDKAQLRTFRKRVQIIFQDPASALDPRYSVAQTIAEALRVHRVCSHAEEGSRVRALLERVGLSGRMATRYPREMSGGERQRVSIARALAAEPRVLLADEPVSSLDVSIQAQIVALLEDLKREDDLTLVLVAHDLALVRQICSRVVTMYLGKVVEDSKTAQYYERSLHPYSYALLQASPDASKIGSLPVALAVGDAPSAVFIPSGCRFHPRCFNAGPLCDVQEPPLEYVEPGRRLACFYPLKEGS